jgi:hypothetical protein
MKNILAAVTFIIVLSSLASAQSATTSTEADAKTVQTVQASEMQKNSPSCQSTTTSKSCCSAKNRSEMSTTTTSAKTDENAGCQQVSFGMSAENPNKKKTVKEEKPQSPQE